MRKTTNSLLLFIILSSFMACRPSVYFENPQPDNTKNIKKIPKHLHGSYLSIEDSTILTITNRLICEHYHFTEIIHLNEIDSNYILTKDSIFSLQNDEKWAIHYQGDSITVFINFIDTIFHLNDNNLLRKLNRNYFLNRKHETNKWEVKTLSLQKNKLTISSISPNTELETLQEITQTRQDSSYSFQLTKKQLKTFIKKNSFSNKTVFIKQ